MSARVSRGNPTRIASRKNSRRKMGLDVDLNVPPPDISNEVGTSSHVSAAAGPQVQVNQQESGPAPQVQANQQESVPQVVPIDVDSIDDDVVLSSPRAFQEAKNRNRTRTTVVDVDLGTTSRVAVSNRFKKRRIPRNQPIINCESYVASQTHNSVGGNEKDVQMHVNKMAPPPPPPPHEPTFNCPVCMGPLVEEMTTKCGHIFCKACIKKSISTQGKCPTCRRKVTMKDTIRIYLPATNQT